MSNIQVTWKDPTLRVDGTPVSLARIDLGMRVAGAPNFTPFTSVDPGVQSYTFADLPPGSYEFSITPVDTQTPPEFGAPVTVAATIPVPRLAAPQAVTDVSAVIV